MYSDDVDDFPLSSPGVKAEKVLGTSEYNNVDLLEEPPRRPKRLRKHPSFMSVTISDVGSDSVKETDDELLLARSVSGDKSHQRPSITRNKPSSPLLGQSFSCAMEEKTSSSGPSSPVAHYSPSSSTLRSYYDSTKSPLLISQQTSASSARDMALRKGCPSISSPLACHESWEAPQGRVDPNIPEVNIDPRMSRPQHIDFPTTPAQHTPFRPPHILSPHLFPTSPLQPSLITRTQKSLSDRTKWPGWERRKSKNLNSSLGRPFQGNSQHNRGLPRPSYHASKMDKPAHNWFDGIENSAFVEPLEPESESRVVSTHQFPQDSSDAVANYRGNTSGVLRIEQDTSSTKISRQRDMPTQRSISLRKEPKSIALHCHQSSSQTNEIRGSPSITSQKSVLSCRSNRNTLLGMDLQNHSVLALSSSEDEDDGDVPSNEKSWRPRIQESIEYTDKGDEVQVLSAERIKSIKTLPVINVRSRRRSRSSSSEAIPPVPSMPARPVLSPRVSSMKWQQHKNISATLVNYADGVDNDWKPLTTGLPPSRSSRSSSQRKLNEPESRIMAVTPDEEKLLEGMRRKRASIRQDNAADLRNVRDSITLRPKTASEDKRPGFFDAHVSQSPPAVSDEFARSLNGAYAASADNLTPEIGYFPEVPEVPVGLHGHTNSGSLPKKSPPSLSFTASDLVPSTPRSRRSPITPPLGLGYLDAASATYTVSPSRSVYVAKNKHERQRTVSSSVVVLDGAEQRAQQLDEEDEITGWAMDRW